MVDRRLPALEPVTSRAAQSAASTTYRMSDAGLLLPAAERCAVNAKVNTMKEGSSRDRTISAPLLGV